MYEARQRKEMVSRRIDRGVARSVQQFKLVINGRLKNESVLKRNYYKNILNKEADGNLISRHILRRKISEIVKSNETYNFPTWRQAIISLIETKTMKLGPISSLVNKSYIINFTTQKILLFRAMETKGLRNCGNPCWNTEGASLSE